jgi:hypothetical protein
MGIYRIEIHDGWLMVAVWLLAVWVKKATGDVCFTSKNCEILWKFVAVGRGTTFLQHWNWPTMDFLGKTLGLQLRI